jgi:outer membrane lipoprotein-sorting protein
MKTSTAALSIFVGMLSLSATAVMAEDTAAALSGLDVARKSDDARSADTERQTMTMTLINKRGQERVRTIEGYSREISEDEEHRFSKFLEPADVKDTTLLSYDYDQKDDDTWLYLPALKKAKRILTSNKTDYFMGSDFTYEDMENLDLVNWDYQITGEETLDGVDCYVVTAVPNNDKEREETGYEKTVTWYAKSDFLPRKAEYTDKKSRLSKRLIFEDIRPISEADPRPRARKMTMENFITEHKTVLDIKDLQLDVEIDDKVFSQRNLRQ